MDLRIAFDGCYDLTHYGHSNGLRQAKLLGKQCVVICHDSDVIKEMKMKPVFLDEEKRSILMSYRWVDEFFLINQWCITKDLLARHNCDCSVHGDDAAPGSVDGSGGAYFEVKQAGKFRTVGRTVGISTTDLLERILQHLSKQNVGEEPIGEPSFTLQQLLLLEKLRKSVDGQTNVVGIDLWNDQEGGPVEWLTASAAKPIGAKVVYAQATFDLLNAGDIEFLNNIHKEFPGAHLIVGITQVSQNGETSVNWAAEKVLNMASLKHVSQILVNPPPNIAPIVLDYYGVQVVCSRTFRGQGQGFNGQSPMVHSDVEFRNIETESAVTAATIVSRVKANCDGYKSRVIKVNGTNS